MPTHNTALLHNCGNCNGWITKQCTSFNPLVILFHSCSLIKWKCWSFLSFSNYYWFSYEGKAYKYLIRFVTYAFRNPPLWAAPLILLLTSITLIKSFFPFAPFFPDEKDDTLFMHELLYLWGGQAGDTHAFLVGRVTQRCQRNIPNLIIIWKMLYSF